MSGTAATGAPLAGATITLVAADGTRLTTTAAADGSYSFDVSGLVAPFVLLAEGQSGGATVTLVSMQASAGAGTVNITPITNAIAASLASNGNPLALASDITTEAANITGTRIDAAESAWRTALGDLLSAAGATGSVNLLTTSFTAGTGAALDKVLDNVQVNVSPTGEVSVQTASGVLADDLAASGTAPAAARVVVLAPGVLPTAADRVNLPASPTEIVSAGDIAELTSRLTRCFASTVAERNDAATAAGAACGTLDNLTYKNGGRDQDQEFGPLFNDSAMNNAVWGVPDIQRALTPTKVAVRLPYRRADGYPGAVGTVVENRSGVWTLVGDGRDHDVVVTGFANRREIMSTNTVRLETGVQIYVANRSGVDYPADAAVTAVKVYGPGLPGFVDHNAPGTGLTLQRVAGCDFWSITATACANLYRFRVTVGGTALSPLPAGLVPLTRSPMLTDAEIAAMRAGDLYRIDVTSGGTTLTYWNRLRARPYVASELERVVFPTFDAGTRTMLNAYTGGTKPTVSWTVPAGAGVPDNIGFFHNTFSDLIAVRPTDRSVAIRCSGNANCAPGGTGDYIDPMNFGTNARFFQTRTQDRTGARFFNQLQR